MPQTPRLYVFSFSHFSEKARWACDRKRLGYQLVPLLPGLHILTTRRLAPGTSVPVLVHGPHVIQNSSEIIDYLALLSPPGHPAQHGQSRSAPPGWVELTQRLRETRTGERVRELYNTERFAPSRSSEPTS